MHPLRDLAAKIEALAKEHEAYSQAQPVVQNCVDHLSAIARCHEANQLINPVPSLEDKIATVACELRDNVEPGGMLRYGYVRNWLFNIVRTYNPEADAARYFQKTNPK